MLKLYGLKDIGLRYFKIFVRFSFTKRSVVRSFMDTYLEKIIDDFNIKAKNVLDIGGKEEYLSHLKSIIGYRSYLIANISKNADIIMDATKPHPFKDNSFDLVISFNLIEHLRHYKTHIREGIRISRKYFVIFIPFTMFYHPDPRDYRRITHDKLEEVLKEFDSDSLFYYIIPVGFGPFIASMQYKIFLYNKLFFFKFLSFLYNFLLDALLIVLYYVIKKRKDILFVYPLGYFIVIKKKG